MNVIIAGCGGHAKVVVDIIEKQRALKIVGVLDRFLPKGQLWQGYPVLGCDEDLPALQRAQRIAGAVIGLGDNAIRARVANNVRSLCPDLQFPNVIHPAATIAGQVCWGEGTVVMAGAVVNTDASIGNFCVLNTLCSVDHDCQLGDFVSLAPRASIGGNVSLGDYTAIGLGASLIHGIQIGSHTVVGAGSTVVRNIPDQVVAFGSPARVIRSRQIGEKYM